MGTPLDRRRRPRASWAALAVLVVLFGPPAGDLANGVVTPHDGCRVVGVVDGDTVKMVCPEIGFTSGRIIGVDTPELSPPRCPAELAKGLAATFHLRWQLWSAGHITARPRGEDRYGRALVILAADGEGVGRPMVERGLARWYDGGRRKSWCG